MVRSTRLDGRAELSVQVVPGQHNRTSLFGRLPTVRNLLLRAKHLFAAAMVCLGWRAAHGAGAESFQASRHARPAAEARIDLAR